MSKIVLTGSIGNITKPLTKHLVKDGNVVSVISTNDTRRGEIESLGAEALIGSMEDAAFLTASFACADVVYFMIPPTHSSPDNSRRVAQNAVSAIRTSGVKRVIFLSSVGAHLSSGTGIILGSYHAEQVFRAVHGISLTIIRPGYFYQNLFEYVDMIKTMDMLGANYGGSDRLDFAHPVDIAQAISEEVLASAEPTIKVRYVISDQRTCDEVASVLGASIGKPDLKWLTFTDQEAHQGMAWPPRWSLAQPCTAVP